MPTIEEQSSMLSEEAILRWSFEHSPNAKLITGLDHRIRKVNKAFLDWFNFSSDEVIGQNAGLLLHSKASGVELREQIIQAIESKGVWKGEVINYSRNGAEMPSLLSVTAIKNDSGEKVGYLGIIIDLTERKNMEAQIAQGEKLANIGEGVATLMHEIRNPLTGIALNVFLLERTILGCEYADSSHQESIQLISKEVKRLDALVKNVLDYARNSQTHPEKVSLSFFLDEIKELATHHSEKNSVTIQITTMPEDFSAFFDPDLMKQVFLNLLRNAVEAASLSSQRTVRIGARITEHPKWRCISSSSKVLLINVDNSGERISEQDVLNLFKPFFTSKAEGIGLGLATASKIVRMHHGMLAHYHIDDLPFFTRFTVALPI
jgi:PAS domain S-box-containing protein